MKTKNSDWLSFRFGVMMLLTLAPGLIVGCEEGRPKNPPPVVQATPEPTPTKPPVRYSSRPVEDAKSLSSLRTELGEEAMAVVLKVNRIDAQHIRSGEELIIPETLDMMAVSPFPAEIKSAETISKLLLVARRVQAFGAYEFGKLVRWGPTSTGKKATPTRAGLYHANWKAKRTISTIDPDWVLPWYVNIDNFDGISLHQYDLPGYPASHSCVRLLEEDAAWVYQWVEQWILTKDGRGRLAYGTPVIIFGDYAYDQPPPWKLLPGDPQAASVSVEEVEEVVLRYLPLLQERAKERAALLGAAVPESP